MEITGNFGKLTLNADGSYTYVHTEGGGTETFTYTTRDKDDSLAHATLTISLGDAAPGNFNIPQAGRAETHVFEAGLPARTVNGTTKSAGSNPAAPTTTQEGTITFNSPDGVSKIELGSHLLTGTPQPFTDGTGTLTAWFTYDPTTGRGEIHYRYTLLDNTAGDPSSVSFAVVVTDADGDRSTGGDLVIKIEDDTPTAVADTDTVAAGQTVAETGNVLSDDVQGADGGLSVVGVVLGPSATPVSGGVGAEITGNFGALTLNADGTYSYAHNGRPGGGTDTFTYTMQDADGSQSTTTLTITVENSSPGGINIPQAGRAETTVSEAGLPERTVNGTTESAGSNPAAPTTTQDGTITFNSPDGVSKVELGGHILTGTPQPFTDPTGSLTAWFTYDLATGRGEIHYRYTLLDNTAGNPSSVSFAVAVTDVDGDRTAGGRSGHQCRGRRAGGERGYRHRRGRPVRRRNRQRAHGCGHDVGGGGRSRGGWPGSGWRGGGHCCRRYRRRSYRRGWRYLGHVWHTAGLRRRLLQLYAPSRHPG